MPQTTTNDYSVKANDYAKHQIEGTLKLADETLGVDEPQGKPVETKSFARVVRKTFSIPETELELIDKINNKALNRKVVLAESEVVRLGFLMLSELSEGDLEALSERLEIYLWEGLIRNKLFYARN